MVAPSEANAYVVELYGNELPPPLLPLSKDDGCILTSASI